MYSQGSPAVLGRQETVQSVTQRAREALNLQRDTARRALLHQEGEFLAATHQDEAAARQNLVNTLTMNSEAHCYNEQPHVRQLEQEVDARFSQIQRELLSRCQESARNCGDGSNIQSVEVR